MDWQSIETAPNDGTHVLVLVDGWIFEAWRESNQWKFASTGWHGCGCCGGGNEFPTHWMPLPPVPIE